MNFPAKLALLMRRLGFTQTSLGQLLGVSQKAVSKWQAGQSRPGPETAKRLADTLGVSVEVLLHDSKPLPFDGFLAEIRADREKVADAYPGNEAAQMHGFDYLQQKRLMVREAERLRALIIKMAEVATALDPSDEIMPRVVRDLAAAEKLADLKRRAAAGEAQRPPDEGHNSAAS